jgi:DNA-binding NtrC family response regulator
MITEARMGGKVERLRVLLVDDDADLLEALRISLEKVVEVRTARSVGDALELLRAGPVDIVVADLRLPDRWGDELLAHVAARHPGTRRLMLTGDADPQRTVRELLDLGVIEACYKKSRADGLVERIREAAEA